MTVYITQFDCSVFFYVR